MTHNRSKAVMLVLIMFASAFALAPMVTADHSASASDHMSTTNGDWAGDGTDIVTDFEAASGSNATVEFESSGGDNGTDVSGNYSDAVLNITHDGVEHLELTTADDEVNITSDGSTTSGDGTGDDPVTVEFVVEDDALEQLPGQPGENTTVTVTIELVDANGDVVEIDTGNPERAEFEVDYEFADRNVMYLAGNTTDFESVGHTERDPAVWQLFADELPDHYVIEDTRTLSATATDGNNSLSADAAVNETVIYLAHSDMADDYEEVADGAESGEFLTGFAGYDAGEEGIIPVFYNEADTDFVDEGEDTYAVYDDTADTLTIHTSDDADEIEFVAANHPVMDLDQVGFGDMTDAFGTIQGAILAFGLTMGAGTTVSVLLIVGLRRRRQED